LEIFVKKNGERRKHSNEYNSRGNDKQQKAISRPIGAHEQTDMKAALK